MQNTFFVIHKFKFNLVANLINKIILMIQLLIFIYMIYSYNPKIKYTYINLLLLTIILSGFVPFKVCAFDKTENVVGLGVGLVPYRLPDMSKSSGPIVPQGKPTVVVKVGQGNAARINALFNRDNTDQDASVQPEPDSRVVGMVIGMATPSSPKKVVKKYLTLSKKGITVIPAPETSVARLFEPVVVDTSNVVSQSGSVTENQPKAPTHPAPKRNKSISLSSKSQKQKTLTKEMVTEILAFQNTLKQSESQLPVVATNMQTTTPAKRGLSSSDNNKSADTHPIGSAISLYSHNVSDEIYIMDHELDTQDESGNFFIDLVKNPHLTLPVAKDGSEHGVDFAEEFDSSGENHSNDSVLDTYDDQYMSHLYLSAIQRINDSVPEEASELTSNKTYTDHTKNEIQIYDELTRIATDTTNSRVSEVVTSSSMIAIDTAQNSNANPKYSGLSAGDEGKSKTRGVWVRGLFGSIKQGQQNGQNGFKGTTDGTTIGVEEYINEANLIGISYTRLNAKFKYNATIKNRIKTVSDLISLYGAHNLDSRFVFHWLFSAGSIKAVQKTKRLVDVGTYKTATAKFNVRTYNLETVINYKLPINDCYIIPNVGLRYGKNYNGGYNEYGTGVYNLSVTSKENSSLVAIAGIKAGKTFAFSSGLNLTPGVHAEVDHYLIHKSGKSKLKLQWSDYFPNNDITITTKKTGYNLGATLLASKKNNELLFTYNSHLRGKYISHQGSIKFKLLF